MKFLKLPSRAYEPSGLTDDPTNIDEVVSTVPDPLAELKEILISDQGMKIDRNLYRSFKKRVVEDQKIIELVNQQNFEEAGTYLKEYVLDKPQEFFTIEKLRKSLGLDRQLTVPELLLHSFGHITHIPSQRECLDEEFDKLDMALEPDDSNYNSAREVFEAYSVDEEFREIVDSRRYANLGVHPSGDAFRKLPTELKERIPDYIKQYVNLERLANVG